jgi:hypothetical protein
MPNPKRLSRLGLFCPESARFPQQHGHLSQTAVRHCCREMGRIAPPIGANRSTPRGKSLHPDPPVKAIPCEIKTLRSDAQTHPSWLVPVPNCRQRTASTPRHAWRCPPRQHLRLAVNFRTDADQGLHQNGRCLVVPVAVTAGDKIEGLRQWASGRCLSADRAGVYSRTEASGGGRVRRVVRAD